MENYTRIIGATSTNIRTPSAVEINQGNVQLTPYDSAKNNGYYNEMSQQIGDISAELTNVITTAGLTPGSDLTQVAQSIQALNQQGATITQRGSTFLSNPVTISNGGDVDHDIVFSAGSKDLSDGSGQVLATTESKRIDASWVAGNGNGGLAENLTVAPDTIYECFAIADNNNNFIGFGFDTSETGSNLLAGANVITAGGTKISKRIAYILTDGASNIRPGTYSFDSCGSYLFKYQDPIQFYSGNMNGGDLTVEAPPLTLAIIDGYVTTASVNVLTFLRETSATSNSEPFIAIGSDADEIGRAIRGANQAQILTDSSSQINSNGSTASTFTLSVSGWTDKNL